MNFVGGENASLVLSNVRLRKQGAVVVNALLASKVLVIWTRRISAVSHCPRSPGFDLHELAAALTSDRFSVHR